MSDKEGKKRNRFKGFVFGLVGGVAGTFAMHYYWTVVQTTTGSDPRKKTTKSGPKELQDISLVGKQHKGDESSTAAAGRIIDKAVTGDDPSKSEKESLSNTVDWAFGASMGGIYGLARGGTGLIDLKGAVLYGTGLWLFADELAVPLLGLAEGPSTQPVESHAYNLGAHIVYGVVSSTVTQFLYRITGG